MKRRDSRRKGTQGRRSCDAHKSMLHI